MQRKCQIEIEDDCISFLIQEYQDSDLKAFDEILKEFLTELKRRETLNLNELDSNKDYYFNYQHLTINYRSTIRVCYYEKLKQLTVKLNNSGCQYNIDLPYIKKDINRHNDNRWKQVKYSKTLLMSYSKRIYRFIQSFLPNPWIIVYYNTNLKRCDIIGIDKYGAKYQKICITFEPGYPEETRQTH